MSETILEVAICERCGVDVREFTVFCYNCGGPVNENRDEAPEESNSDESPTESPQETTKEDLDARSALDRLADQLKLDEDANGKLANAAAERKKKRGTQRKPREFTWEPSNDSNDILLLLLGLCVAAVAAVIVFYLVFWK